MILKIEMRKCANIVVIIWILMKVHSTSSFSSAKYVWPLTNSTFNYEIKTPTPGNYSQCGFHFDGSHPSFSGLPLKLDAYSFPFIDINIGSGNEFKSFSFAMSVHISGSTGCIFHFKSTTSSDTITDVSVCIDGTRLTMDLLPDPGATAPSISVISFRGQWIVIQAGRDQSSSKMKFIISTTTTGQNYVQETPETYGSSVILGLPGILRIGAKHDNSMALSMMVTCITMYDVSTNTESNVGLIEDQCKSPPTVSGRPTTSSAGCSFLLTTQFQTTPQTTNPISTEETTTFTAQCNRAELGSSPRKRSGSFILVKENEFFNDPSNLIGSVNVGDKKRCAVACFEVDDCLSFLYRYNDGGPSPCSLFKTPTPSNGSQMLNSSLYVVKCQ